MRSLARLCFASALAVAAPRLAAAQGNPLAFPQASPKAVAAQTVGLTEIAIAYHRPAVNGRVVWGKLVPYGEVWRAGANENTVITFSSPVSVEGHALAAGSYGLHMIPTDKSWTVIFSTLSTAWGSFGYDAKEDALRVMVTPRALAEPVERLAYTFDDPTDGAVTVALRWEKLAVPFRVTVDTNAVVAASLRAELRGAAQFNWRSWDAAADWCLKHDTDLDEAQRWLDRSLAIHEGFPNLHTKSLLLAKRGDAKGAAALRESALAVADEQQMNLFGYQLVGEKKPAEALEIFRRNAKAHPTSWNVYDSLAECLLGRGDKKGAVENYTKALGLVQDAAQKKRITEVLARLKQ